MFLSGTSVLDEMNAHEQIWSPNMVSKSPCEWFFNLACEMIDNKLDKPVASKVHCRSEDSPVCITSYLEPNVKLIKRRLTLQI